jgi:hypothetical protein
LQFSRGFSDGRQELCETVSYDVRNVLPSLEVGIICTHWKGAKARLWLAEKLITLTQENSVRRDRPD